jgi:N-acyl-D-amino-acid deacylase
LFVYSGVCVFDLLIRGGTVVDGSGAAPYRADVGVADGRIVAVGDLTSAHAATALDATGRTVAPGLIDTHAHADATLSWGPAQAASLRQGVTTLICGQDGLSFAPASPDALAYINRYFAAINGVWPDAGPLRVGGLSVADLRAAWHRRSAVNSAYLVPHASVRLSVLGAARARPDADQLARMRGLVEDGLSDGAVGISSGLEYRPGAYADAAEIAALCAPVAAAGLPYVTHMRGYGVSAPAGVAEARAIATAAGVALHISHFHGPGPLLESLVDGLLDDGVDTSFDSYPYLRGCTILAMAALPTWVSDVAAERDRVLAALDPGLWPRVTFAHVPSPDWAWVEGLSLTEAADRAGRGAGELLLDVLLATDQQASAVIEQPSTTTDDGMRRLARHRVHMGCSDGILIGGHPHPRAFGAFARYLGRHVRELGDWSWADAVEHLSVRPARRFGLTDRGAIRVGAAADLAIVDTDTVADRASYERPRELAVGVADVVVNGVVVLRDGELTGALAGQWLSPYPGGPV